MVHKYTFSFLAITAPVLPCQRYLTTAPTREEIKEKQQQEVIERTEFHIKVHEILKDNFPGLKANYRRVKNLNNINDNSPATSYVIVLPKNTQISKEQKELVLYRLHALNVAGFHFEK